MLCYTELSVSLESYMEQERQDGVHSTPKVTLSNVKLILGVSSFKKTTAITLLEAISKLTLFSKLQLSATMLSCFLLYPFPPNPPPILRLLVNTMIKESPAGF